MKKNEKKEKEERRKKTITQRVFPAALDCLLEDLLRIGEIPVGIVDPHHEVLPFWFLYFQNNPAHLFHVDAHSDMADVSEENQEVRPPFSLPELIDYTTSLLWEGDFICPAVWLQLCASISHFDPRENMTFVYKQNQRDLLQVYYRTPQDHFGDFYLVWGRCDPEKKGFPLCYKEQKRKTTERINCDASPLLLDIDLDAFECCKDPDEREVSPEAYQKRLQKMFQYLQHLKKPSLITIARSQTPRYVPADRVDAIQQDVLEGLREVYAK